MGSDGLFCFISICKIGSFKTLLQWLLASLNITLDLNYPVGKNKKNQKLLMAAAQAAENHGDESSLTCLR